MTKKRIIITDAKKYHVPTKNTEIFNLLLVDGKILGYGYLPDDETAEHLDCKEQFIVPNTFNLASCFSSVAVDNMFSIKQLPILNIDAITTDKPTDNQFIVSHQYPYQKLTVKQESFLKSKKAPLIILSSISEALFMLQNNKINITIHIILKEVNNDLINHISQNSFSNISFGFFIEDILNFNKTPVIELLESKKITSISSRKSHTYFDSFCSFFGDDSLYIMSLLFEEYSKKIFQFNMSSFKLFNSPSFNIIHPNNKQCSTYVFRNGIRCNDTIQQ